MSPTRILADRLVFVIADNRADRRLGNTKGDQDLDVLALLVRRLECPTVAAPRLLVGVRHSVILSSLARRTKN
jgi:hypothetical protein